MDLLAVLTAAIETETAVLGHQLDELVSLRTRAEAAQARVGELGKIINASKALIAYHGPASVSHLITIRQSRQRIEAAVAELETIEVEYQAIAEAADRIIAGHVLRQTFPAPLADA